MWVLPQKLTGFRPVPSANDMIRLLRAPRTITNYFLLDKASYASDLR